MSLQSRRSMHCKGHPLNVFGVKAQAEPENKMLVTFLYDHWSLVWLMTSLINLKRPIPMEKKWHFISKNSECHGFISSCLEPEMHVFSCTECFICVVVLKCKTKGNYISRENEIMLIQARKRNCCTDVIVHIWHFHLPTQLQGFPLLSVPAAAWK